LSLKDTPDGRALVHCFAGCAQLDVIEALRHRGLWPSRLTWTAAERAAWRRRRNRNERDLPAARWFSLAARLLAEEALRRLDAAHRDREALTEMLSAMRTDDGKLKTYRRWGARRKLTRALVAAGQAADAKAQKQCARWLMRRWNAKAA
jgi:hypothetical protein